MFVNAVGTINKGKGDVAQLARALDWQQKTENSSISRIPYISIPFRGYPNSNRLVVEYGGGFL